MPAVRVPVPLRWSDMDAYGHVNNTEFLRLLEQARIEGLGLLRRGPGTFGLLVARHEIEYLLPLAYRAAGVVVEVWCTAIGGASFDLGYQVVDAADGTAGDGARMYARAASTMVVYDLEVGAPRRLRPEETTFLGEMSGPPVGFRRGFPRPD